MVTHVFEVQKAADMSVVHSTVVYIIKAIQEENKNGYILRRMQPLRENIMQQLPYLIVDCHFILKPLYFFRYTSCQIS